MSWLQPYVFFIFLSFLVSLVVYSNRESPVYLKLFPIFLLISTCIEVYALYLNSKGRHNIDIYNLFSVFEFCFYLWVIGQVTSTPGWKKIIRLSIPFYAIFSVLNIFFIQGYQSFHSITYCIGCLLIVIYSIHYFFELFQLPKWGRLTNNPAFWICSGLLFFYCCGFPFFGLLNYWATLPGLNFLKNNYELISNTLNILLYALFTIAFLCNRTRKYTLSSS